MKVSRLYLKILVAFVLVLLVAQAVVFALVLSGRIRPPFTRGAEERTQAVRRFVDFEITQAGGLSPQLTRRLDSVMGVFAESFRGQVWLTDEDGHILSSSFHGSSPSLGEVDHQLKVPDDRDMRLYLIRKNDEKSVYVEADMTTIGGRRLTVHLLHRWKKRKEELWMMRGLLLMSGIAALLLIPISRRITRPMKDLTESAERLAHGDFSQRVKLKGKDEVAVLARTFNRMADNLEKMLRGGRELTANMSHELRSPLARIRLSQQIMQDRLDSGRTDGFEKHLYKMESEIEHMDKLIDKILKLSKLDLQEQAPCIEAVNLTEMLEEAIERHESHFNKKEIVLEKEIALLPVHSCNAEGLRSVLDNVLTNAAKYTAPHGKIFVSAMVESSDFILEVVNSYVPLSDKELEAVFVPFTRLGYDTEDGSGLGLSFARKIVEEHGGTIEASNHANGFCLTIRLPE